MNNFRMFQGHKATFVFLWFKEEIDIDCCRTCRVSKQATIMFVLSKLSYFLSFSRCFFPVWLKVASKDFLLQFGFHFLCYVLIALLPVFDFCFAQER